jgi:hypothetical protein
MTPTRVNLALGAALCSLTVLGACMTNEPMRNSSAPLIIPQTFPYTAGTGVVQSVTRVPDAVSAAAGSSSPAATYRLGVRMDNGTFQYIDVDSSAFSVGNRIELGPDRLIKPY